MLLRKKCSWYRVAIGDIDANVVDAESLHEHTKLLKIRLLQIKILTRKRKRCADFPKQKRDIQAASNGNERSTSLVPKEAQM